MKTCLKAFSILMVLMLAACGASERPAPNSRSGTSSLLSLSPNSEDPDFDEETFNEQFDSEFGGEMEAVDGQPNAAQQLSGYAAYRDLIQFSEVLPTSVNRFVGSTTVLRVVFVAAPSIQTGIRWFRNGTLLDLTVNGIGIGNTTEADEGLYTIEVYVIEANGNEVPIYRGSCAMYVFPVPPPPPPEVAAGI